MNEKEERKKWIEELKKECKENRKKPNGFKYFTLGFSTAVLLVQIIVLIIKFI